MLSLRQMVGTPVVAGDEPLGFVERAVLTGDAARLQGVVVRRGLGLARWFPHTRIELATERCVVVRGSPERPPKSAERELGECYLDVCVGLVTDALLCRDTLRVAALEVSAGPLFSLSVHKAYVREYRARPRDKGAVLDVVAAELLAWEELAERRMTGECNAHGGFGRDRLRAGRGGDDDAR